VFLFKIECGEIFSFGGLYQIKRDAEGKESSFLQLLQLSQITLQKPIYDRMPLIIDKKMKTDG
jgi:putative SOS response-associated peptidase YedK